MCKGDFLSHIILSHIAVTGWPVSVNRKCCVVSRPQYICWDILGGARRDHSFCVLCLCDLIKGMMVSEGEGVQVNHSSIVPPCSSARSSSCLDFILQVLGRIKKCEAEFRLHVRVMEEHTGAF